MAFDYLGTMAQRQWEVLKDFMSCHKVDLRKIVDTIYNETLRKNRLVEKLRMAEDATTAYLKSSKYIQGTSIRGNVGTMSANDDTPTVCGGDNSWQVSPSDVLSGTFPEIPADAQVQILINDIVSCFRPGIKCRREDLENRLKKILFWVDQKEILMRKMLILRDSNNGEDLEKGQLKDAINSSFVVRKEDNTAELDKYRGYGGNKTKYISENIDRLFNLVESDRLVQQNSNTESLTDSNSGTQPRGQKPGRSSVRGPQSLFLDSDFGNSRDIRGLTVPKNTKLDALLNRMSEGDNNNTSAEPQSPDVITKSVYGSGPNTDTILADQENKI